MGRPRIDDIINQQFGELTVLHRDESATTKFVGTFGVFVMKHYAEESIEVQVALDELEGETYRYEIVEFNL